MKYRQTLPALGGQLAEIAPAAAGDVAVLGTQAGASAMEAAFTSAFGGLAPATRVRHLSALRRRPAEAAEPRDELLDGRPPRQAEAAGPGPGGQGHPPRSPRSPAEG